ncbi:MAG: hypothetical protein ABIQ73_15420 [Acidimicrobiales bacterium]
MNLEQLDELLRRYREAEQKIAATLVDLEAQPTYKLVTTARLRGTTAARLQAALESVPELWRAFSTLREVLDEARTIRGQRRSIADEERQRLETVLASPSILISVEQLPLEQRSLLGPTEKETRITPEQLIAQMSATFATVTEGVGAVERAWRDVVPRIDAATTALARLVQTAEDHDAAGEPALDSLRDTLQEIETTLAEDPLGMDANSTARLDATLAIAEQRVGELSRARGSLDDDLARAGGLLADLRKLRAESAAVVAESSVKIADYHPIDVVPAELIDGADGLAAELGDIRALTSSWRERRRQLDAWLARAEPLSTDSAQALAANRAPLRRRGELRGLLDAYRAKAADIGLVEDEEIAALVRAANQELHTAPTSLVRAEQLVTQLSAALGRRPKGAR